MMLLLAGWMLLFSGPTLASPTAWLAEDRPAPPIVIVHGGGAGGAHCVDGATPGLLRCVVWSQGDWQRITVDGEELAARQRTWLPLIGVRGRHG